MDSLSSLSVIEQPMPSDVVERWQKVDDSSSSVLILPTQTRASTTYYQADDVEALKIARRVGLEANYLVDESERRFLNEFAAEWALDLAIGIMANLGATGIEAVIAYIKARTRRAVELGRHDGPEQLVPLKIQIAKFSRDPLGEPVIKNLKVEGPADAAIEATRAILASSLAVDGQSAPQAPGTERA